jgi:hypothetical protein
MHAKCKSDIFKKPLEKPRCRWEKNIKMDLKETEREIIDWIEKFLSGFCRDDDASLGFIRGGEFLDQISNY